MKIQILSKKDNPLLKRKEIAFEVDHGEEGQTPPRIELKRNLANMLKTKLELVFIEKAKTKTGATTASGEANIYESIEQAKLVEPPHIIARNSPDQKPAAIEEPKKEETKPEKLMEEEKPAAIEEPKKEETKPEKLMEEEKPEAKPKAATEKE